MMELKKTILNAVERIKEICIANGIIESLENAAIEDWKETREALIKNHPSLGYLPERPTKEYVVNFVEKNLSVFQATIIRDLKQPEKNGRTLLTVPYNDNESILIFQSMILMEMLYLSNEYKKAEEVFDLVILDVAQNLSESRLKLARKIAILYFDDRLKKDASFFYWFVSLYEELEK